MLIKINKQNLDDATKKKLGVTDWRGELELDLSRLKPEIVKKLTETLTPLKGERGMTKVLRTIKAYNDLVALPPDEACAKARTVEQYYASMKRIIAAWPSKRIYQLDKDGVMGTGRADGYYIERMTATPRVHVRHKGRDGEPGWTETRPGYVTLLLVYITDRGLKREETSIREKDLFGKHPNVAIANAGYVMETPELKAAMIAERKRWREIRGEIGLQLRGVGMGELLSEESAQSRRERDYYWYENRTVEIKLDKDGPAPLVVDVDKEGDTDNDEDDEEVLKTFAADYWMSDKLSDDEKNLFAKAEKAKAEADDDDDDDVFEDDDSEDGEVEITNGMMQGTEESMGPISELPVHPWLTCFNLRGHQRVRLHMSQTTNYTYDTELRNKLVIDTASRTLIEMLLHQREQFKDSIKGKGGGAVILCAGPPGVGKTLTSEIFAESEKRPLYSVQCSQLGTSATQLEASLLKIFARAQRWKAILLLDEADVYIAKRGNDMNQNAIVGVFLRVLEYYNGVMFMTTNRADSVDDAVLSRCVARIDYENPSKPDQVKIWHILAAGSGLKIKAGTAETIAEKYSLSGRDVKQVLKLAGLVAYARQKPEIDVDTIEYCLRFKPTERISEKK